MADYFVSEAAVEAEEAGVGHLWVVRDDKAGIGVSVFWLIGSTELCFVKEDPGPSCLGGSGKYAGEFLQIGDDGLAKCSDFFTGGHGTGSIGTGLDGEAGPDGWDIWRGDIHLEVVL